MTPVFHLSLPVRSVDESVAFFADLLGATVTHRDASGYVNLEWFGTQLTLAAGVDLPISGELHFGINVNLETFERMATAFAASAPNAIAMQPKVVDAGTPRERRKMYVRCPSGYLIELKAFAAA
ncbi:MAG: hypothetical protein M3Q69_14930 [Acidobacteriota bacterium]|nr:hypothetical protein [Acidobacteriota bacterium]